MNSLYQRWTLAVLLLSMQTALAQRMDTPIAETSTPEKEETVSETRRPSWFHSPKKTNATEQMAYAHALLEKGKVRAARKQFLALVYEWQAAPEAPKAQTQYAALLEKSGRYEKAFKEYQYLMDHYVGSFVFEDILNKQFALANSVRTQKRWTFWGLFDGVESPERSLDLFEQITRNSPGWERTPQARFYMGEIEEKQEDYHEAADDFGMVVLRYRRSPLAADAAFRRGRCLYLSVQHQPRDEAGYREALSALASFIRDYPTHEGVETATGYIDELKERLASMYYEIAVYYDQICHRNEAAIIAYQDFIRNFPSSELSVTAHRRIEELRLAGESKTK